MFRCCCCCCFLSVCKTASCSESEIGWTVKDRIHIGNAGAVQVWVTPLDFPCHGVVTHWRYWAKRSAPFRAMVLRNVDNGGTLYDIIGINEIPAGDINQEVTYQVPDNERVIVQAGDVIGFGWNSPVPVHVTQGEINDDDVLLLKFFSKRPPNDLRVNDRINASETFSHQSRSYSIKAVVSGIFSTFLLTFNV